MDRTLIGGTVAKVWGLARNEIKTSEERDTAFGGIWRQMFSGILLILVFAQVGCGTDIDNVTAFTTPLTVNVNLSNALTVSNDAVPIGVVAFFCDVGNGDALDTDGQPNAPFACFQLGGVFHIASPNTALPLTFELGVFDIGVPGANIFLVAVLANTPMTLFGLPASTGDHIGVANIYPLDLSVTSAASITIDHTVP